MTTVLKLSCLSAPETFVLESFACKPEDETLTSRGRSPR